MGEIEIKKKGKEKDRRREKKVWREKSITWLTQSNVGAAILVARSHVLACSLAMVGNLWLNHMLTWKISKIWFVGDWVTFQVSMACVSLCTHSSSLSI